MSHDTLAGLLPAGNPLAPFDAAALLDAADPTPDLDTIPEVPGDAASGGRSKFGAAAEPEPAADLDLLPDEDEELLELEIAQDSEVPAITPIPDFSRGRVGSRGSSSGGGSRGAAAVIGRRRSRNAPLIVGMGLVVSVAIGVCVFLLVSGFGISQHGELVATRTGPSESPAGANPDHAGPANPGPANADPANADPANADPAAKRANQAPAIARPRRDPVMGGVLPPSPSPPQPAPPQPAPPQTVPPQTVPPQTIPGDANGRGESPDAAPAAVTPAPPMDAAMESLTTEVPAAEVPAAEVPAAEPPAAEPPASSAAAMENAVPEAASQSPLEPAIVAIRNGRYEEMLQAAEQAQQAAQTPEQRELAAGMHLLAELADYYVEGIRRGAAGVGAAETFEIVPDVPVIMVESDRDSVVLKINGRVKSYSLESMPLVLAHRLTKFSLPADDPVAKAAAGAYQAVWPQATDAHRRQAFEWWRNLDGESAGADFSQLEPTVREIFEMPDS